MTDDALDPDFEALLVFLREDRGVDFTGYKRASLRRLVARRMQAADAPDLTGYLDQLQVDPAEVRALFDSLLINVTAFFRDPEAWESLRERLPALIDTFGPEEPLRIWSAACATGEEAYTLAVLLHELLGDEAYLRRVKIYATDIDEPALAVARAGRYTRKALAGLTEEQVERYFPDDVGGLRVFRTDLRPTLIFGRHDLLADAPISRIALLACRNALMYFTAETQARILQNFSFALHDPGLLMLGRAEMLLTNADLFSPVDLPRRLFRPVPGRRGRRMPVTLGDAARNAATRDVSEAAFRRSSDAQVVLDAEGAVALLNDSAVRELGMQPGQVGRPFQDCDLAARLPALGVLVNQAQVGGLAQELQDVSWPDGTGRDRWWDVQVGPLLEGTEVLGVQIAFVDVTRHHALTAALQRAQGELQSAYEELQSSTEELETTNEELQSAVEELETTNEELQSTNEELETMNEELQSTNEELQTVNDELRDRTGEVGEANAFLESVLSGLTTAVAVVDLDLKVIVWNAQAEQLWGLRAFEVEGERLAMLPGHVPVTAMLACLRPALRPRTVPEEPARGQSTVETDRFGTKILLTLTASPLLARSGEVRGAILTMAHHDLGPDETGDGG